MTAVKQVKQTIVYRELSHLQKMFRDLLSELSENAITFPVQSRVMMPVRLAAEGDDLVVELGNYFEKVYDLAEGRTALWEATQFAVNALTGQNRVLLYGTPQEPQKVLVETMFDDTWINIDRWHRRTGSKRASLYGKFRNGAEAHPVEVTLDQDLVEDIAYLDEYFEMDEDIAGDYFSRVVANVETSAKQADLPFLRSMVVHPNFWVREAAVVPAVMLGRHAVLPEVVRCRELLHTTADPTVLANQLHYAVDLLCEYDKELLTKQLKEMRPGKSKSTRAAIDGILDSIDFEENMEEFMDGLKNLTNDGILRGGIFKTKKREETLADKYNLFH